MGKVRAEAVDGGVGRRLRMLRAREDKTAREVAVESGVSYDTLMPIEQGRREGCKFDTLRKLTSYYGVAMDWLITGGGPGGMPG